MPKIKSIETVEDAAQSVIVPEQKIEEDGTKTDITELSEAEDVKAKDITELSEVEDGKAKDVKVIPEPTSVTLPKVIDDALKNFRQYPELYVDSHGGAFTTDTKPELRESAILYQNTYYNN